VCPKLEAGHSYIKRICSVTSSSSCVFRVLYLSLLIFSENVDCNITVIINLWSSYCSTIRNHLSSWDQFFVHLLPHSSIVGHSTAPTFSLFWAVVHCTELKTEKLTKFYSTHQRHSTAQHRALRTDWLIHYSLVCSSFYRYVTFGDNSRMFMDDLNHPFQLSGFPGIPERGVPVFQLNESCMQDRQRDRTVLCPHNDTLLNKLWSVCIV
jgi:hypothetical protein